MPQVVWARSDLTLLLTAFAVIVLVMLALPVGWSTLATAEWRALL
jgi:hypothetical protein